MEPSSNNSSSNEPYRDAADADGHYSNKASATTPSFTRPAADGDIVVEFRDVSKTYRLEGGEEVPALHAITMALGGPIPPVRRGEFLMIRGPSGGGKTTILNLIGTIDAPTKGTLRLFGDVIGAKTPDAFLADLRLHKIGFVFQSFNLLATLSAFENVELPMSIAQRLGAKSRKERAQRLLQLVGLEDRMTHLPSELSGGEQQRVTIARALANEPELLLADEPTGDLDVFNTVAIMDLLMKVQQEHGMTTIMVTHNPDLECYANRILYVADGRIVGMAINESQSALEYDAYMKYLQVEEG